MKTNIVSQDWWTFDITMDNSLFRSLIESLDDGLALIRDDNTIIYCNSAFRTLRETTFQRAENASLLKLYPPSQKEGLLSLLKSLRKKEPSEHTTLFVETESGRQFSDTYTAMTDKFGEVTGIIVMTREVLATVKTDGGKTVAQKYVSKDVTEIKKEKTIKEITNRRKREITALHGLTIAASEGENTGEILMECLRNIMEMFSLEAGEVRYLDKKKQHFSPPVACFGMSESFVKKSSAAGVGKCLCGSAIAREEIVYSPDITLEEQHPCKHCIEEGFKLSVGVPLFSQDEIIGILHLASHRTKQLDEDDLSLLKIAGNFLGLILDNEKMNEKAEIAREYLKGMIAANTDPIIITDPEGNIIDISPALERMTGFPRKKLLKTPAVRLFPESFRSLITDMLSSVLTENKVRELETHIISQEGDAIPVGISASLLRKPEGTPLGIINVLKNRADEKSLQKEIQRRNKEFSLFYSLSFLMTANLSIQEFTTKALHEVFKLISVIPRAVLYESSSPEGPIELVAHVNMPPEITGSEKTVPRGECLCSSVLESGEVLVSDAPQKAMDYRHHGEKWNILVPVKCDERVRGVLVLYADRKPPAGAGDTQLLAMIGNVLGAAMVKHTLLRESISHDEKALEGTPSLRILQAAVKAFTTHDHDEEALPYLLCREARRIADFRTATVSLFEEEALISFHLFGNDKVKKSRMEGIPTGTRLAWVIDKAEPLICDNLALQAKPFREDNALLQRGVVSHLSLPILWNEELFGVLTLEKATLTPLGGEQLIALELMIEYFAALIHEPVSPQSPDEDSQALRSEMETLVNQLEAYSGEILRTNLHFEIEKLLLSAVIKWFAPEIIMFPLGTGEGGERKGVVYSRKKPDREMVTAIQILITMEDAALGNILNTLTLHAEELAELPPAPQPFNVESFLLATPLKLQGDNGLFFAMASGAAGHFELKLPVARCFSLLLTIASMRMREISVLERATTSLIEIKKALST
ncbi:MAG: GAF domain-containing protein [Candidatus Eremiobacteraeota bacterium]|nr:GAF domain-containing protein [Candidatus Eremiobacteraeota bacterium]